MALKLPNLLNSSSTKITPLPTNRNKTPSLTITFSTSSSNGSATTGWGSLRVAYQGSAGAYSEYAARLLSPSCTPIPCPSISAAVAAVESSVADRAIMPVESTLEGSTLRNYGLLLRHDLVIVQEINLFVNYCLLAMPGVPRTQIRKVISHPMALAHCGRMLQRLGLHSEAVDDTAGAVEMLRSQQLLDTAAIASPRAATIYGLDVIAHGIQDENWNVTRFLLLSKSRRQDIFIRPTTAGPVKTSMVVAHRGGSMTVVLKVLSTFSKRNINLSKLEVKNPAMDRVGEGPVMIMDGNGTLRAFSHVLYVDFEGSSDDDDNLKEAVEEIKGFSVFVRILGCYAADTNVYDLH